MGWFCELVQVPDGDIQIAGKRHPRQIGHEEPGGSGAHLFEGQQGEQDRGPECKQVDESRHDLMRAEEDPRPEEVKAKLHQEKAKTAGAAGAGPRLPDDPCGHCHEDVKNGPHGTEDLIRRIERRLDEARIPGGNGAEREDGGSAADSQA